MRKSLYLLPALTFFLLINPVLANSVLDPVNYNVEPDPYGLPADCEVFCSEPFHMEDFTGSPQDPTDSEGVGAKECGYNGGSTSPFSNSGFSAHTPTPDTPNTLSQVLGVQTNAHAGPHSGTPLPDGKKTIVYRVYERWGDDRIHKGEQGCDVGDRQDKIFQLYWHGDGSYSSMHQAGYSPTRFNHICKRTWSIGTTRWSDPPDYNMTDMDGAWFKYVHVVTSGNGTVYTGTDISGEARQTMLEKTHPRYDIDYTFGPAYCGDTAGNMQGGGLNIGRGICPKTPIDTQGRAESHLLVVVCDNPHTIEELGGLPACCAFKDYDGTQPTEDTECPAWGDPWYETNCANFVGTAICGDETCSSTEDCSTCPQDCGTCPECGDGSCNGTETCGDNDVAPSCNTDCGTCPPDPCGNGTIDAGEDCDFGNIGTASCESIGYQGGTLACNNPSCTFNTSGCTSPAPVGEVLYLQMNSNMDDASGNGNNGSCTECPTLTTDRFGNADSAYAFDGVNDYITVPNSNSLNISGTNISISLWANPVNTSVDMGILAKGWMENEMTDPFYQYAIEINQNGDESYDFYFGNSSSSLQGPLGSGNGANYGNWEHIVFTYDGSAVKHYIDGVEVRSQTETDALVARGNLLIIGADAAQNQPFQGSLDDIRIYDRTLDATEVTALYNEGAAPSNQGDLNNDGVVDIFDLVIIGSNFNNAVEQGDNADPSGDGYCNIADLGIVAGNFGNEY